MTLSHDSGHDSQVLLEDTASKAATGLAELTQNSHILAGKELLVPAAGPACLYWAMLVKTLPVPYYF